MNKVFISYSHKDEKWKERLLPHLKMLEQQNLVTVWDDRKIDAGDKWYPEIEQAMAEATAAICLISADFLASDFCVKEEIPALLERNERDGMLLIPVLLRDCFWKFVPWLKELQMLPRDGRSVQTHYTDNWDEIFAGVAEQIAEKLSDPDFQPPTPKPIWAPPEKIDIEHLLQTGSELFGRQKELELLDEAWETEERHIISFVAWGGVGKSTLVNKWLQRMAADNYRGAKRVFGWSFYSQGTNEKVTSADKFISDALEWFGDSDPTQGSSWDKGVRLARLIQEHKTLLILDGLEPLQEGGKIQRGKVKDAGLAAMLRQLALGNPGLCVITTRETVTDLQRYEAQTTHIDLEYLTPQAGRALLRVNGVRGTDAELEAAAQNFGNHALAINLLGAYLHDFTGHAISVAQEIADLPEVTEKDGKHPRRIMNAFIERFGDSAALDLLLVLGLFDRPADLAAIAAVKNKPVIKTLTEHLSEQNEVDFLRTCETLRRHKLLAAQSTHSPDTLDCHPLVREHFGERLQEQNPNAWREAHSRLYDYYKNLPDKELPDTLAEMEPLFAAVAHGCLAGKHQEALDDVYWDRIIRKQEAYSVKKLGAFGADLAVLSNFFDPPWRQPAAGLTDVDKAVVLSWAGFGLRALGRLREAAAPMQAGLENDVKQKNWKHAAMNAGNLSELFLTLGEVPEAVKTARQSVDFADRSGDDFQRECQCTALADALHQSGALEETENYFREAEAMQQQRQPEYRYLYSLNGFRFCDLLLSRGQAREVLERAGQALEWAIQQSQASLLTLALDTLSLGRAHFLLAQATTPPLIPPQGGKQANSPLEGGQGGVTGDAILQNESLAQAEQYLNQAVAGLREAGRQDDLPLGLLARTALGRVQENFAAAWEDLNETQEIAERGEMRLHLADFHLEACRVCLAEQGAGVQGRKGAGEQVARGKLQGAMEHVETAAKMIEEMGYHRRDGEVVTLREEIEKLK